MLVLNNGVPKSGSTWVIKILRELISPVAPDRRWQREDWNSVSIHPDRLEAFIDSGEWQKKPVMLKTHIAYEPKYEFLLRPEVRVIVTYRNLPDSMLSMYHHQVRKKRTELSMEDWLVERGERFSQFLTNYRNSWSQHDDVLMIPYENMVDQAPAEIRKMARFLGLKLSEKRFAEIAEKTQVRLKPGEAPREGKHSRTGGQSRARLELPPKYYELFAKMEASA